MLSEDLAGGASKVGNHPIGNEEELHPARAISLRQAHRRDIDIVIGASIPRNSGEFNRAGNVFSFFFIFFFLADLILGFRK